MPEDINNVIAAGATVIFNGVPLGYTEDALTMGYTWEELKLDKIQQKGGVHDIKRTTDSLVFKLNIVEFTLENWKLAWAINSNISQGADTRSLDGNQSGDLPKGELMVYGKGPNGVARTLRVYRACPKPPGEINMDSRAESKIPLTLEALWSPSHATRFLITEEYIPTGA